MSLVDEKFMAIALEEARKGWGMTSPNPMVGALVVNQGEIVGRGYHLRAGLPHAEVEALRDAGEKARGATVYVTLEPCSTAGRTPACTGALINSGVAKVVIGVLDPNPRHSGNGMKILENSGIEVICNVLESKCRELNRAFFTWITTGKPFVLLKMAMTLDGKIADKNGTSKWITGEKARSRVQMLRRWADAIMVTGKTVRLDNPKLTVREPENWQGKLRKIIATDSMSMEEIQTMFPEDANVERQCFGNAVDFENFLKRIGAEEITALLIEGGGELAGFVLECGMADAVEFHVAPKILCGRNSIPVTGGENRTLPEAVKLINMKSEFYGDDLIITADTIKE